MRRARFRLALIAAALVPGAVHAFEWSGRAGVLYTQDDSWTSSAEKTSIPRLDVDLALDASGFVQQPDLFTWSGGVGYRRLSVGHTGQADDVQDRLDYRLRTVLFGRRGSPFTVSALALRSDLDGSVEAGAFSGRSESYGGNVVLNLPGRPSLDAGYVRSESTNESPFYPEHRTTRDAFNATTAHSTSLFSYRAAYRGTLDTGTFASDNHDDHRADVDARIRLSERVRISITEDFYRRTPTLASVFNPTQELNTFSATIQHTEREGPTSQQLRYSHTSGLTESATQLFTRKLHRLDYQTQRTLSAPEWSLVGNVGATYDDRAADGERQRSAGQSAGATLQWVRQLGATRVNAQGGPSFGLVEPFDGTVDWGYGGSIGGGVQRSWTDVLGSLQYSLTYGTGVGTETTTLSQQVSASAEGSVGSGRLRAELLASGDRSEDPLFGLHAARSLRGRTEYTRGRHAAWLEATLRDGVADPLRAPFGDGLFLSPGYDTHNRTVAAGGRATVARFVASGSVHLVNAELPDRPAQDELQLRGELSYRLAAFGLSIEDRYVKALGDERRANVVFLRVYRLLGSRY